MSDNIVKSVEDLNVFRKAYDASLELHKLTLEFPKIEQFALADQIRRASKSICANLAEGFAKQRASSPEYKRFLLMAIGSADEMQIWLRYCLDLGYIKEDQAMQFKAVYKEIAKMLSGLRKHWN